MFVELCNLRVGHVSPDHPTRYATGTKGYIKIKEHDKVVSTRCMVRNTQSANHHSQTTCVFSVSSCRSSPPPYHPYLYYKRCNLIELAYYKRIFFIFIYMLFNWETLLRQFTWTNKQFDPLLERLDLFFSSNSWTYIFPNAWASALSRDTLDHTSCLISALTSVPKPHVFRFENYWLEHHQFMEVLQHGWNLPTLLEDKAKRISYKFKNLRKVLKSWKNH